MLIIAGWLRVAPSDREAYLAGSDTVMRLAKDAPGCLDFYLTADPTDPGRIRVYERWESDEDLERFRGSGPDDAQTGQILDADVKKYRISAVEAP
jgi:quinol monooxygenase YgiN